MVPPLAQEMQRKKAGDHENLPPTLSDVEMPPAIIYKEFDYDCMVFVLPAWRWAEGS
jgi:hypothetical protein